MNSEFWRMGQLLCIPTVEDGVDSVDPGTLYENDPFDGLLDMELICPNLNSHLWTWAWPTIMQRTVVPALHAVSVETVDRACWREPPSDGILDRALWAQQAIYGCEKGETCPVPKKSIGSVPIHQPEYRLGVLICLP